MPGERPIRTFESKSPPARIVAGESGGEPHVSNSIIGAGTVVHGEVRDSVLFADVEVHVHTKVERSIVFDDVEIAAGCQLCNCIVDKHTRIPRDERIGFDLESDRRRFTVTDRGIAVVPKGYNF